jgi:amino acid transporter
LARQLIFMAMFKRQKRWATFTEDSNLVTFSSSLSVSCRNWSDDLAQNSNILSGGTIGTGLFLGIGRAFASSGPLSVLLGYTFTGVAVFAMMQCLGEMATWLPLPGAIPQYCARYVDPAMGFAVGWNNWYSSAITLCAEISAASVVIGFWNDQINVAAWISIIIIFVICLNIFAVSIYGEAEFIFASIKIVTIIGLLILALVLDLGGGPTKDRLGFRYW